MRFLLPSFLLFFFAVPVWQVFGQAKEQGGMESDMLKLTVVFNNEPLNKDLGNAWGFACVIEGLEKTILFDTGLDGQMLLANMKALDIDPESMDLLVFSHFHGDHTNGLVPFLERNSGVTVYMPRSFPDSIKERV